MNLLIVKCEESLICCAKKNTDVDIESNTDGTDEHGNVLLAKHQSEKSRVIRVQLDCFVFGKCFQ